MSITQVTDIFAFACSDAQWWELALPADDDEDDPPELVEGIDPEALDAARQHVGDCVEALLTACLLEFQRRIPPRDSRFAELQRRKPRPAATRRNQDIGAMLGQGNGRFFLHATLENDWEGKTVRLYSSVTGRVANIDKAESLLPPILPRRQRDGNAYYLAEVLVEEGVSFAKMSADLVDIAWPDVLTYLDAVSPRRTRRLAGAQ